MSVYYKFKSVKDYESIPITGCSIPVFKFKEILFEKHLGKGTDYDLILTNAQTNEEYVDGGLIPNHSSILVQRIPGVPRMPIVCAPVDDHEGPTSETEPVQPVPPANSSVKDVVFSVHNYFEDTDWHDFGHDVYEIKEKEIPSVQPCNTGQDAPSSKNEEEDRKIKALVDAPALDWGCQTSNGFGSCKGFRKEAFKQMGTHGLDQGVFQWRTPPPRYVCRRCQVPGHFIQHCPTNGDPNFDIKRVNPPTGIPKSMLLTTPDGSYALPNGAVASLKRNEAAFDKEIEGLPSINPKWDIPPELHCPLCKKVMKDAVFTSKCCFKSFCDNCIRTCFISKSQCMCGATNVLADDLLPNMTLRDTIVRLMESSCSSSEKNIQPSRQHPNIPPISQCANLKAELVPSTQEVKRMNFQSTAEPAKTNNTSKKSTENIKTSEFVDVFETGHKLLSEKEPKLQKVNVKAEKKQQSLNGAKNYTNACLSAYNPCWNGMYSGMEGYTPFYGYGLSPFNVAYVGGDFNSRPVSKRKFDYEHYRDKQNHNKRLHV